MVAYLGVRVVEQNVFGILMELPGHIADTFLNFQEKIPWYLSEIFFLNDIVKLF